MAIFFFISTNCLFSIELIAKPHSGNINPYTPHPYLLFFFFLGGGAWGIGKVLVSSRKKTELERYISKANFVTPLRGMCSRWRKCLAPVYLVSVLKGLYHRTAKTWFYCPGLVGCTISGCVHWVEKVSCTCSTCFCPSCTGWPS